MLDGLDDCRLTIPHRDRRSGGPADPGLDTPSVFAAELPRSVREDYDLIGFDPRGAEYSTPQS